MRRRILGVLAGVVVLVPLAVVVSRKGTPPAPRVGTKLVQNLAAYLPAQCYAETRRAAPNCSAAKAATSGVPSPPIASSGTCSRPCSRLTAW